MSTEKKEERREEDNGKADGEGNRGKSSTEVVRTVTEEEVDRFFKILRRVHVAARTVTKVNGDVAPSKKRKQRNSLDTNGVRNGEFDGITRVGLQDLGLDLNCKPEPDCVSL